jgi:hypothetical protein
MSRTAFLRNLCGLDGFAILALVITFLLRYSPFLASRLLLATLTVPVVAQVFGLIAWAALGAAAGSSTGGH